MSDSVFAFDRLMLFDEEHSDPVALTEILLETCSSITHSLGKWSFPVLCLMINCSLINSSSGGWLVEEVQKKHKLSCNILPFLALHCGNPDVAVAVQDSNMQGAVHRGVNSSGARKL